MAIPARNEAERLPRLLAALAAQTWLGQAGRRLAVTVVLNNCTDGSRAVVAESERRHPELRLQVIDVTWTSSAHVGRARRMAMEAALAQTEAGEPVVVFTSDADAQPEPGWIDATLQAISAGADAVGGLIIGDPDEEARLGADLLRHAALERRYGVLTDRLASLVDPAPHDPWPRHRDHTGASLAVRAEVYRAVGGLPPLPVREDLALVSKIRAAGYRLVHPLDVRVLVSARLQGRAPGGMADCLRAWIADEAAGRPHLVEDPNDTLARLEARSAMRRGAPGDPARIERWAADPPDPAGVVPVALAIAQLEAMIATREGIADAA